MLTIDQQKWIDHLSDTDTVVIVPFDTTAEEKFLTIKKRIHSSLGVDIRVEHHGATSLGISGQDEIDVYIPVVPDKFDALMASLDGLFGKPASMYPRQRARFVTSVDDKHIDVFLINENSSDWRNCVKFESYLKNHSTDLETYRKLKESGNTLSTREYYRIKTEFINEILAKS